MRRKLYHRWRDRGCLAGAALGLLSSSGHALAQKPGSPFTQAEVTAGHLSFHGYCAGCHGDHLQGGGAQGGGDAPPLTGALFRQDFSKSTVRELYQFVSKTMPDGLAGDLSAKTYADILSFVLAANGARPGPLSFNPRSATRIGDIANGRLITAVTNAPIGAQAKPRSNRRP